MLERHNMLEITPFSKERILEGARYWSVPQEYQEPMYNYLVQGWPPGSFFTALLANDMFRAVSGSHPSNSISSLKTLVGWIQDKFPPVSYGCQGAVTNWVNSSAEYRRYELEGRRLIYTPEEETMLLISRPVPEHSF